MIAGPTPAPGVQELFHPDSEEGTCPAVGGSRGGRTFGTWEKFLLPLPDHRRVTRLTDRQIEWLIRQAQGKAHPRETVGQMAARWGVSIRRLRQLLQRWRQSGEIPRLNPRRRPPGPPLTEEQKRLIEEEHQRQPRGATKLYQALLKRGHHIPKMQIYRYARAQRWVVPNLRKQRRRHYVRYERAHSGSLVHGDFHRTSETHPHAILWEDDASRLVLAGNEVSSPTGEAAIATLELARQKAAEWGLDIREVNTDRGSQFFASKGATPGSESTQFGVYLAAHHIRHIVSRINHPQTNGKLERLWLEYDRHRWRFGSLEAWIAWNNDQIHESLWIERFETPTEAWQRKMPIEVQLGQFLRRLGRAGVVT
jgi:putative transposase